MGATAGGAQDQMSLQIGHRRWVAERARTSCDEGPRPKQVAARVLLQERACLLAVSDEYTPECSACIHHVCIMKTASACCRSRQEGHVRIVFRAHQLAFTYINYHSNGRYDDATTQLTFWAHPRPTYLQKLPPKCWPAKLRNPLLPSFPSCLPAVHTMY